MSRMQIVCFIAVALVVGAAAGLTPGSAIAQQALEKCYGISPAGQDDGLASGPNAGVPGTSKVDFDGNAFKLVRKGSCTAIATPHGPGSLNPVPGRPPAQR